MVSKGVQMSEYNITEVKFAQNHTTGEEKELSLEIVFVRRYVDLWTSLSMYSRTIFQMFQLVCVYRYDIYFFSLFIPTLCLIVAAMITLYLSTDHFEVNIQVISMPGYLSVVAAQLNV